MMVNMMMLVWVIIIIGKVVVIVTTECDIDNDDDDDINGVTNGRGDVVVMLLRWRWYDNSDDNEWKCW